MCQMVVLMWSCNPLIRFHVYLINESGMQGEVRCRISGKDTCCGLWSCYSQVTSTIVVYGFCMWKRQVLLDG